MGTGIPKRYRGVSFDRQPICDLDPTVLRQVRSVRRARSTSNLDAGQGLWFYGDVGTGKTSLAMLVSKAALDAGHSVAIYSVPHLLAEISETYDRDSRRLLHAASSGGSARSTCSTSTTSAPSTRTDWVLEQLYSIVNERWQDQRSIVVTTNILDLDELREQIGTRTVSRLAEICGDPIPIMGRTCACRRRLAPSPTLEPSCQDW